MCVNIFFFWLSLYQVGVLWRNYECDNINHPRCTKLKISAGTLGHDNIIGLSTYGELSVKISICGKIMEVPIRTDQYYNTVEWSVIGNNKKLLMMLTENKFFVRGSNKDMKLPIKIGENTYVMKCLTVDRQPKPFIMGMQTLISSGFSFGIGDHCVIFGERPVETMQGFWPHNELSEIENTRYERIIATKLNERNETRTRRPSRIPRRVLSTEL